MSEPRRTLHLVIEGLPGETIRDVGRLASRGDGLSEICALTPAHAAEVLEKIFAADSVKVWSPLLE